MSAQLQHYVPQFLLRRFGRGKTSQIHVFDKGAGKKFSGPANKLAAEREFYDFEFIGVPVTLEASLSQLESEAAQCVAALLKRRNLATENSEMLKERSIIIRFLAVQLVRTKGALAKQADISEQLRHIFSAAGMPEEFFKPPS